MTPKAERADGATELIKQAANIYKLAKDCNSFDIYLS